MSKPQLGFPSYNRTAKHLGSLNTLHQTLGDEFTSCWGRVEEFLVAGEQDIVHTKPFFFPFSSAATCTNRPLEVDQSLYTLHQTLGDEFTSCWGRVEEFLVAGVQEIVHTKPFFFPFLSAVTCTNCPLDVDQRFGMGNSQELAYLVLVVKGPCGFWWLMVDDGVNLSWWRRWWSRLGVRSRLMLRHRIANYADVIC
ncbi:hypothetical protein Taro_035021 [Colocasia esculenta]|uniref:Uncharacterized protein n=1 Tax=Colocasia esculenta TaxID=4460 RepID=A0A843WBX7_COLES|nr:hypothetical protein [Colocasia esculenta]